MLKNILSGNDCASCRICCVFDRDDVWEIPVFTEKDKRKIMDILGDDIEILERDGGYVMASYFKDGEELTHCPALGSEGCKLGEAKPFDCLVWPFRVMRIKDDLLGITLSPVCKTLSAMPISSITEFLFDNKDGKSLADKMFSYARKHPFAIKKYIDDYPILAVREG